MALHSLSDPKAPRAGAGYEQHDRRRGIVPALRSAPLPLQELQGTALPQSVSAVTASDGVRRFSVEQNFSELIEEGAEWYRAADYDALRSENAALKQQVERITAYAQHIDTCPSIPIWPASGACTCGLEAALKEPTP